ncbi:MAG: hypothetical protein EBR40_09165 [Proteobacteria bacterium]|nr:hypothetical protein [Pseudomonadota bacterium]
MARKKSRSLESQAKSYARKGYSAAKKALAGVGTTELISLLPWIAGGIAVWWAYTKLAGGQAGFDLVEGGNVTLPPNLPRPDYVYADIADRQYNAMNMWFTDEESLFAALEGLNKQELIAVASKFGKRASTISLFPGTQQSISFPRSLTEWYDSELSGSDRDRMKAIWFGTGLY